MDDFKTAFGDKAPNMKAQVCIIVERFVSRTYIDDLCEVGVPLVTFLLTGANDMNGDVRD